MLIKSEMGELLKKPVFLPFGHAPKIIYLWYVFHFPLQFSFQSAAF